MTKREIEFITILIQAHKGSLKMLRGFKKLTREEQDEDAYYNRLIEKITNNSKNYYICPECGSTAEEVDYEEYKKIKKEKGLYGIEDQPKGGKNGR